MDGSDQDHLEQRTNDIEHLRNGQEWVLQNTAHDVAGEERRFIGDFRLFPPFEVQLCSSFKLIPAREEVKRALPNLALRRVSWRLCAACARLLPRAFFNGVEDQPN